MFAGNCSRIRSNLPLSHAFMLNAFQAILFHWWKRSAAIGCALGTLIGTVHAATIGVTPSAVSNTYSGVLTLQITGLTNGEQVIIQRYLDINANGAIDAGESPVALDGIAAGRHTVTFVTSSGSVKRTIRVEAGRTAKLDVPIFSGWVGIYAPFVLDVVEGGHVIGTTEEPRILLSPGKHELTLVNRELGYSSAQTVDIEPGEVKSISIDPRGHVSLNATPWAEVWIDGRKVGDTPVANLELPLGVREVTFRHPQFGERRVIVTVKGNTPAAISIDMSKP